MDDSPDGALSLPFEHCHIAEVYGLPVEFDSITGPQEIAPGVRVTWATNGKTLEKLPQRVQFDADRMTPDDCRKWLASHNVTGYTWLPADSEKPPQYRGSVENPDEEAPPNFASLQEFYQLTQEERSALPTVADVRRAGESLRYEFELDRACDSIARSMKR
jgi:hypothetical protein